MNSKWRLEIHQTGDDAIDKALQIAIKPLASYERAALSEPIKQIRQEQLL